MHDVTFVFLCILAVAVYFAPWMYARARGHQNAGAIAALTLFLGWTVIGWIIALVWACSAVRPELQAVAPPKRQRRPMLARMEEVMYGK